jgi:hypothetical protein
LNVGSVVFLAIAAVFLVALPRRFAVIPLLLAAAYTTKLPVVQLGPANLSVLRVLVIVGIVRVVTRGEHVAHGINAIDRLLFAWATLLVGVSVFHTSDAWTYRIGAVLGELGVYMLCRVFVQDLDDVRRLFKILCVALVPLAILMLAEKYTAHNLFAIIGASDDVTIREGHVRAAGPFAHAILAGTVGAASWAMAVGLWRSHRVSAVIGMCAAAGILFAATSSGPLMIVAFTGFGLMLWNVRAALRTIRWAVVVAIIGLQIVMQDPVYFLMARIDITGGSTGWYRAQLIRSSIEHLDEWWAVGTDSTRHWMGSGIAANEIHADIVNHYLAMGVMGGLPLMILFVLVLSAAFREVGRAFQEAERQSPEQGFFVWTLGAMLFGQVVGFWAISLYDQSVSFFYLILATISASRLPAAVAAMADMPGVPGVPGVVVGRWKRHGQTVNTPVVVADRVGAPTFSFRARATENKGWAGRPR